MMSRRGSERERYWRGVMREQRASGLSMAAFCRGRGVAVTSLYNWRGELKRRAAKGSKMDAGELANNEPVRGSATRNGEPTETPRAKFVPVDLPASPLTKPPSTKQTSCEVVLPNGCRILVPMQCDASWLREILEVLKDRAC